MVLEWLIFNRDPSGASLLQQTFEQESVKNNVVLFSWERGEDGEWRTGAAETFIWTKTECVRVCVPSEFTYVRMSFVWLQIQAAMGPVAGSSGDL